MQGKLFIIFLCLMIISFLIPTHQLFKRFFDNPEYEIFPLIRLDTLILFAIGSLGLCVVYIAGIIERYKLKKHFKMNSRQNLMQINPNDEDKEN